MIEIDLDFHRRGRIWLNEFPNAQLDSTLKVTHDYEIGKYLNTDSIRESIAIELYVPLGGRSMYGLLGAELIHFPNDSFTSEIYFTDSSKLNFNDAMCMGVDSVWIGLPKYYADSVESSISAFFKDQQIQLSSVVLKFKCSAYCEINSNAKIFEILALAVCKYLFRNKAESWTKEQFVEMLNSTF
jgi:hypothetical protein